MKKALFLALLCSTGCLAQDSVSHSSGVRYFLAISNGLQSGEKGTSITTTSALVQGVTYGKRIHAGIGIGFDTYAGWQTMPLFGQLTYDLGGKKNVVFAQVGYGWSHAWTQRAPYTLPTNDQGGKMFSAMIGYRIPMEDVKLFIMAGYKFQSTESVYDYSPLAAVTYPYGYQGYSQRTEQNFERLVIAIGFGWR
jgi:hypothetical protein